jgi:hypothetical protein
VLPLPDNPLQYTDPTGHAPCVLVRGGICDRISRWLWNTLVSTIQQAANFVGPRAKGFDWDHIMTNHSARGKVAQQRLRDTQGKYDGIFGNMTDRQIKTSVQKAWHTRARMETQIDPVTGVERIRYRGYDQDSGLVIEMWFNKATGIVETAYPVWR